MRIECPKSFVHSRLKSYIDGNLKLKDIKHPSKITFHEPHIRNITRYYPAPDHDTIPNSKLKSWTLRAESRVQAYIHGQMTINELVHPSKITKLSQQAIKQKIQKSKILKPRPAHPHPRRRRQTHWIELGRQLDRIASSEYDSFHSPPFEPRSRPHTPQRATDELPEAKQSIVFNGNVNILYVNMARKLDQNQAKPICQNIQDIDTISRKAIHPDLDRPLSICQQLIPLCLNSDLAKRYASGNANDSVTTVGMLTSTIRNLSSQYQHVMSNCSKLAMERDILLEHQSVSDRTIDILAHRIRELKRKNESSELMILELNETRALEYQNQKSDSTMHHLAEEVAELKRKNETLAKFSKKTMQQLKNEIRDLKHHNQYLADRLNEKIVAEETVHLLTQKLRQLKKQNGILTTELQQQITHKNQLSSSVAEFKSNLNSKIKNIEQCFNSVLESIQRTEETMRNHSSDTGDTNMLLNTIHKLDEQNAHLMGKIKLFPEMLKRTLAHVSCSMNALEEQNVRLVRALQNTEIEYLSTVKLRKRVRTLSTE